MAQSFLHGGLALLRCQVQDLQIFPVCGGASLHQGVVSHAKLARREQLLAIPIVRERSRLPHQPVDDVPIVDALLVPAAQTRLTLHQLLRVPHLDLFHVQAHLDALADQTARHRIRVAAHVDRAPAVHSRQHPLACLQPPGRQTPQHLHFLRQPLSSTGVELLHQFLQELGIGRSACEVPAATQHQRLVHCFLETPMPLFDVAVLVRMVRLDLLPAHPEMRQQRLVTLCELLLLGKIVHGRAHAVAAVTLRHATQLPQRVLQSLAQALETLRKADRRRFPVRVRQHEVIHQMIEALPRDGDVQRIHRREVGGAQPARFMDLAEEDFFRRPRGRPPAADVPLQGPQLTLGKATGMAPLQFLEDGLGLKARIDFKQFAHRWPHFIEGVRPCPPIVRRRHFAGPFAELLVLPCRLLVHVRSPRRLRQCLALGQQPEQLLDLLVRDHSQPSLCEEVAVRIRTLTIGNSNCRRPLSSG